jgi:uncharacterized RDD family membrane protein YckC
VSAAKGEAPGGVLAHETRLWREFVTPEGIALPLEIAGASDRLVAFVLDALIIALLLLAVIGVFLFFGGIAGPVLVLAAFLLTHFYFTIFELRWQGRTPGKRLVDLRVIDRDAGPLSASAVFIRNVSRELEVVFPLIVLLHPTALLSDAPPPVAFAAFGWMAVLGLFPLLNRDRLRVGDLIAGTIVVHAPRAALLPDLAEHAPERRSAVADSAYAFTSEQLDIYGIYELQVLEEVLRRDRPDRTATLEQVAEKVARKIGFPGEAIDPEPFLRAFYAAQRARLEQRLLLGDRKERKSS